jgi:hypothetical protein
MIHAYDIPNNDDGRKLLLDLIPGETKQQINIFESKIVKIAKYVDPAFEVDLPTYYAGLKNEHKVKSSLESKSSNDGENTLDSLVEELPFFRGKENTLEPGIPFNFNDVDLVPDLESLLSREELLELANIDKQTVL